MILLRSFLSGHIRIKRTLEYYDAGIGPRVPFGGGFGPTVSANFAVDLGDFTTTSQTSGYPTDWTTLASTSTMPTGGSISRAGNAMLYDSTGKLTYAPNNLVLSSNNLGSATYWVSAKQGVGLDAVLTPNYAADPFGGNTAARWQLDLGGGTTSSDRSRVTTVSTIPVAIGTTYILSMWIKSNTASSYIIRFQTSGVGTFVDITVTPTWQRFYYLGAAAVSASSPFFGLLGGLGLSSTADLLVYGAQLEAVTYQTTPSTYNATTTSAYYGPRFDYDPVTLAAKGLLVEGQLQQLVNYTQDFSNAYWTKSGTITPTYNAYTSPDGTLNASRFASTTQFDSVSRSISSLTIGAAYTFSMWVRLVSGSSTLNLNIDEGGANVNRTQFTATSTWQRVSVTRIITSGTATVSIQNREVTASTFECFGAQLELRAFPTSYIPAASSGSSPFNTRAAETFSLTGYANRLVEAFYIDEQTGANFSGNSTVVASGDTTINPPTFGWVTSLRAYTNAYATSPTAATNVAVTRAGGTAGQVPMLYDSTGTLTYAPNNLVLQANTFDTSVGWYYGTSPGALSANTIVAPDGNTTASAYTWGTASADIGFLRLKPTGTYNASTALIYSIWVKVPSGTKRFRLRISDWSTTTVTGTNQQATTTWQRFSYAIPAGTLLNNGNIAVAFTDASGGVPDNVGPGDILHVWGPQLEAVTYQTRPSGQYYNNYPTPNTTSAYIGPRYDYNPSTVPATALGLLVEGTRTNLLTYSQDFRDTATAGSTRPWSNSGVVASISGTSPDGSSNANLLTEDSSTGLHRFFQSQTIATGVYTISLYAKPNGRNWVYLYFDGGLAVANFNVSTGAVGTTSGTSFRSASTQSVGNGWYRVSMTLNNTTSTVQNLIINLASADTTTTYAGNGTSGIYFYGVQLEAGGFATSYIPTVASSIDRATETLTFANNTNRLVDSFFIDEATGGSYSQNTNASSTSPLSLTAPTFGWSTSLRSYTNAYAGSISTPSWLSFSRAGNAMYYDSTGTLTYAPANLIQQSQTFNNVYWTKSSVTVSADAIAAPDGTTTADNIISTVGTGEQRVYANPIPSTVGIRYTYSVYAKTGGANWLVMRDDARGFADTSFDLVNGVVGTVGSGRTASILSVGSGWYRCSVTVEVSASWVVGSVSLCLADVDNGRATFVGNGVKSIYLWGAQLEPVTYQTAPSAYIPTTSAAVYGPRYDYDPSTVPATPRGLLIEESRANIAPSVGNYTRTNCSFTGTTTTAPDGTSITPLTVTTTAVTNSYAVVTATANTMTYSIYAKKGSAATDANRFGIYNNTTSSNVLFFGFNYDTGAITYTTGSSGASAVNVGNGWWRISITPPSGITSGNTIIIYQGFSGGSETAGEYAYVWGAQLEAGSFATSYIPTTTASVTRAADVAQLTGSALTTLQGANWTFMGEVGRIPSASVTAGVIGTNSFGVNAIRFNGSATDLLTWQNNGSTYNFVTPVSALTNNTRIGLSGNASGTSSVASSGTVVNGGTVSWAVGAYLGYGASAGGSPLNSTYRSLALYNQRLPDAILKQKSSVGAPY